MMSFPGICNLNRISIYPVHFLLIVLVCDNACIWKVPCVIVVSPSLTSSLFFLSLSLSLPPSLSLFSLVLIPHSFPLSLPPSLHTHTLLQENILLRLQGQTSVKVIDFGSSCYEKPNKMITPKYYLIQQTKFSYFEAPNHYMIVMDSVSYLHMNISLMWHTQEYSIVINNLTP